MTAVQVSGAPRAQGYAQGCAQRGDIRATFALWRRALGWRRWRDSLREARRETGPGIARFLPQQHERLQGLALAAGVPLAALAWLESAERDPARGGASGSSLAFEPRRADGWIVRRSEPDAGGYPSVELCSPERIGCFAGVNRAGVAVACAEDAARLGLLAQDVLLRAASVDGALEHLRRRGRYLRQSGTLLVTDRGGSPRALCFRDGELSSAELATQPENATLRLDAAACALVWRETRYEP